MLTFRQRLSRVSADVVTQMSITGSFQRNIVSILGNGQTDDDDRKYVIICLGGSLLLSEYLTILLK